ncbi:MAG: hypothetical protein OK452_06630 [Thaumarchaeota archaeon]|nr:hypothetical protein [Nitrososphaerota archaeon]
MSDLSYKRTRPLTPSSSQGLDDQRQGESGRSSRAIDVATTILAVMSVLLPVLIISLFLFPRALPWWMDGGDWLKRVNALLGNSYPMWNQTTFQYPPLFFILVAALSGPIGEIRSLELWALLAYALVPLATYFFVNELFHDRVVAVAGAWLTGFSPIWFEMFGWGGYPDLLGLALLPLGFLGVLRFSESRSSKNLTLLASGSVLIPVAHHLTFIAFVGVLVIWGLASVLFDRKPLKAIGASLLVTLVTFGILRLAAGPEQFLLSNQAALTYLLANGSILLYMFKNPAYLAVVYIVAVTTMGLFLIERKYRTQMLLLVCWALVPVLGSQGYLLGVASDYNRVLFFFVQPFMLMVAASLVFRTEVWAFLKAFGNPARGGLTRGAGGGARIGRPLVVSAVLFLSLSAVITTPVLGAVTMRNIDSFYNTTDTYGDSSKLQVANFISSHTPSTAVVVAETTMARWIEGYAQRRVLLNVDPRYLFLEGELGRQYAASAILFSDRGIRNGHAWVFDQAPYSDFSPLLGFFIGGEYQQAAVLNDSGSRVSWVNTQTGKNFSMPLTDSNTTSSFWAARSSQTATIGARYLLGPVEVVRDVSLSSTNGNVSFTFHANSSDPNVAITGLKISLAPMPGLGLHSATLLANRTVAVLTDLGYLFFNSSSAQAFPFKFAPAHNSNVISGWANVWTDQPGNATGLYSYDRSALAKEYGVTDVVIPRQYLVPVGQTENITLRALPTYENLMRDPDFKVVYYNERAIVMQFVG